MVGSGARLIPVFVQLVLSNVFGQNAPAIAAAEATYEQMYADVAAMVGYHGGASAAAAALAPWQAVPGHGLLGGALTHRRPLRKAPHKASPS